MRCAQSGRACPCLGDGYFDYLKYNGGGHETGWSCGSVRPPSDDEFDKGRNGGVKNGGYGDKAIDSRRLSESELTNLVRRVLIEKEHIKEEKACTDDTDCETGGPRARCIKGKCGHGKPRDGEIETGISYSPVDWWEEDEEFGGHVSGGLGCCSRHSGAACVGGFECVDCACQPVVDMIDYDDLEDLEIDTMIPYGPGHPEWPEETKDIREVKRLMGYDVRLTLTEQGGGIPICMGITAQGCPGTPEANTSMTTPSTKCATIDNIPVTVGDQGRDIIAPMGGPHMTIQSVFPNVTGNGSENVSSAPGPCPRPNTSTTDPYYCVGGVAGMSCVQSSGTPGGTTTGGPFNTLADCQTSGCGGSTPPIATCNKTCQQLVPGFKKKAGNKPCNWLDNRLNAFRQKLSTKTPGSCGAKRITCKIGVVKSLRQQKGC